jgi:hypothetical protein
VLTSFVQKRLGAGLLGFSLLFGPAAYAGMSANATAPEVTTPEKNKVRQTEPLYEVQAGMAGEIFPVFANYAAFVPLRDRRWGTVAVTITNAADSALHNRVTVQVPGWSDQEIQFVDLAAGEVKTLLFAPSFLPRLYQNHEIAAATVLVRVSDAGGRKVYENTTSVRLRAADDMFWGEKFKYAPFVASWVTPHNASVEAVLRYAKEFMPGRRLPGYETWKSPQEQARTTALEAKAIYRALQKKGVSYVKSSSTFGASANAAVSERVRMPFESLRDSSANCIDGAVMFASLFENLGMDPVIVLVPGHAYVGVRIADDSDKYYYIETAVVGRNVTFEAAVKAANEGLAKWPADRLTRIQIDDARRAGIYPMPLDPMREHVQKGTREAGLH